MSYSSFPHSSLPPNSSPSNKPIRILHVVGGMDRGGVETWLMHVLRQIDRTQFQLDFLAPADQNYQYTDELKSLGSQIFPCLEPSRPWLYAANFKQILREHGPYDIVHVHVHLFSGYVLHLATQFGVKVRIIHSHSDTSSVESTAKWPRRIYNALMKWWIARNATGGLVASRLAAADLLGASWEKDPRWQALCCGIDLKPFDEAIDSTDIRREFGISADAFVVGHVGRFDTPKNHRFLIEIVAEIANRAPNVQLVLIGTGMLQTEIEMQVREMGLAGRVIFLGARADVPRLMIGLMDVFLFPSLYEGLGLVLIEAQAAGLPCVLSDVVPIEADLVESLMHRLSLNRSASEWADAVLATSHRQSISKSAALELISQSAFNIDVSVAELTKFYTHAVNLATNI